MRRIPFESFISVQVAGSSETRSDASAEAAHPGSSTGFDGADVSCSAAAESFGRNRFAGRLRQQRRDDRDVLREVLPGDPVHVVDRDATHGFDVLVGRSVSPWTGFSATSGRRGSGRDGIGPYNFLTVAIVDCGSTLPATTRIALFGAYHCRKKLFSAAAVVASNDSRVPSGSWAYGVPANRSSLSRVRNL